MLEISGKHPERSDEELLLQFKRTGSLDTLGELYSRYMHLVYGVSLKYLENREEAKDAVMQIFEKLVTDLPGQEVRNFKNWLFVLTKNHSLMQIRSQKSVSGRMEKYKIEREFMESEQALHPIDEEPATVDTVEDALKNCIEQLKNEQKQCIVLFYYEKLCYQEIAEKIQISEKMVKSYLQNGKRNLKICLEKNK
ncbi:MAG: sigma-70 family RNA polymerase sigma factor [Bacteroidales bacterium]|nr:sigma-70 family RNA polymerase sigma factor [Bacteroidales bacterium]